MLHYTTLPLILVRHKCNCYHLTCGFKLFDLPLVLLRLIVTGLECQVKFFHNFNASRDVCSWIHSFVYP